MRAYQNQIMMLGITVKNWNSYVNEKYILKNSNLNSVKSIGRKSECDLSWIVFDCMLCIDIIPEA